MDEKVMIILRKQKEFGLIGKSIGSLFSPKTWKSASKGYNNINSKKKITYDTSKISKPDFIEVSKEEISKIRREYKIDKLEQIVNSSKIKDLRKKMGHWAWMDASWIDPLIPSIEDSLKDYKFDWETMTSFYPSITLVMLTPSQADGGLYYDPKTETVKDDNGNIVTPQLVKKVLLGYCEDEISFWKEESADDEEYKYFLQYQEEIMNEIKRKL